MFSVNQVKNLYVVKSVLSGGNQPTNPGDVTVFKNANGSVYLKYMGEGGLITSDVIKPDQIIYATSKTAANERTNLKKATLTLNPGINGGNPIAGEDYIVDIMVSNYIIMADESTLVKFGAVRATAGMTASDFYVQLAKSFARNFSRDINKFFKIYLEGQVEEVTVHSTHTGTYTGVTIVEQPQTSDYVKGEFKVDTVNFQVIPHMVLMNGDEVQPFNVQANGSVAIVPKTAYLNDNVLFIGNGYTVSDMEYFCMGERGDQYRQMGYPKTIRTKYMVDETLEYDLVDIAFYFVGRGINSQKSEKNIVLACPTGAVMGNLVNELNTALGITIVNKP